ncbi:brachyurin [Drosophila grimshawi]|uniref:GH16196 n=1 Tax=Drosophila grimshawi TaxID=7222 RepID=B4IX31_DROGR|nr:brachyurin [Drosophila grimshawi]EDV96337.1 GH16196 [Drosophila grimshawi]
MHISKQTLSASVVGSILLIVLCRIGSSAGYAIGQAKFGNIENFPYQVMLIGKQLWRKRILCGGTLLDRRWILTAGHCTMGVTHFDVYLGTRSVAATEQLGGLALRSNKFIVHERFHPETAANDIALVKLPADIEFTSRIRPAALPIRHSMDQFTGKSVVASGWGAIVEMTNSDAMQYTELKVISNAECNEEYDVVTDGVMCAKGLKDETVCTGDSGGPLVLKGTQLLVGITSFGPANGESGGGCERTNIPGGFTRVTYYLDWIESKIGSQPHHHQQQQQQQHHPQHRQHHIYRDDNLI